MKKQHIAIDFIKILGYAQKEKKNLSYESRKDMELIKPKEKTNKSLRISLTEKCNYKCFFCHEEGLDMKSSRKLNKTNIKGKQNLTYHYIH